MKHLVLFAALLCAAPIGLFAQDCGNPQAQLDLYGNALRVRLLNAGDLGWDFTDPRFQPEYVNSSSPSTIYAAALWMGGIDQQENLVVNAQTYRASGRNSYWPGPLDPSTGAVSNEDCLNWDRFFKVTAAEIAAFQADWADGSIEGVHSSIRGWPATGNPFFASVWGFDLPSPHPSLAPYHDENLDGQYNPLDGDYPVVQLQGHPEFVPSVQIWSLLNDNGNVDAATGGANIPAEIYVTAFQFNCPDNPVINNTMFTNHRLICYAHEPIDSFYMGLFVDFDLGCYTDDYVGSRPASNTFYGYNSDNIDQIPCSGVFSFGENPPVQAVTFLNAILDHCMAINNISNTPSPHPGTTDPQQVLEYYNYITGRWRDGFPLTQGGTGYNPVSSIPATHIYPDNPNDPNGWSMAAANLPPGDQRALGTHYIGTLYPGQIQELTAAWSYHRAPGQDHFQNVTTMFSDVDQIQALFDNNFEDVCKPFVLGAEQPAIKGALRFAPNPARNAARISFDETTSGLLRIFNQTGAVVWEQSFENQSGINIQTAAWPSGIYVAEVVAGNKVSVGKLELVK